MRRLFIVCKPPFLQGVEPPTKFSKRGGELTGPRPLEGVAGKERGDFFRVGVQFSHKK